MNDFTKEELKEILITLEGYDFDNIDLINKIKSMIDTYCDHEDTQKDSCLVDSCKCGWVGFKDE